MNKVGVMVAVEIDAVLKKYGTPAREEVMGGFPVRVYVNDSYEMYVIHSGAGELSAAAATQVLISLCSVDLIVNFGVVGGLTPEMAMSSSCIIERVVHYEMDTSALDGYEVGRYGCYPDVFIPIDRKLVEKALEIAPELKPVTCASGDKFVADPAKKNALHEQFGADICEMEAAAVALTCDRCGVPCIFIKTLSDSITGGAEEFTKQLEITSDICMSIADRIIQEF